VRICLYWEILYEQATGDNYRPAFNKNINVFLIHQVLYVQIELYGTSAIKKTPCVKTILHLGDVESTRASKRKARSKLDVI
jgi:hypothetical protein